MVILFNVYGLTRETIKNLINEAKKYGDVCEHKYDCDTQATFFLAFGGTYNMYQVIDDIRKEINVDKIEAYRITECYGEYDDKTKDWLLSYLNKNC